MITTTARNTRDDRAPATQPDDEPVAHHQYTVRRSVARTHANRNTISIVTPIMTFFDGILLASCFFDFLIFATLLWLAGHHASSKGDANVGTGLLLAALVVSVGIVVAKTMACALLGLGVFGLVHLLYLDIAIVAPAVGILILAGRFIRIPGIGKVSFGKFGTITAASSFLLIPICVYASFVEPFNLQVETCDIKLPDIPSANDPITIAVLADLQFDEVTTHETRAVELAMRAKPDLILIPGDVLQMSESDFRVQESAIKNLLGTLEAPGGVFLVSGDCERFSHLNTLMKAIEGSKIQFIDGQIKRVRVRGTSVSIAGIPIDYQSRLAIDVLQRIPAVAERSDLTIMLAHRPGVALLPGLPDGIDLIVAGHTHGGQIQIPWFGPPVTASPVPRHVGAGGLSRLNDQTLYVSRGVGCERRHAPRIRFCCPPEVSILTVRGATK